MRNDGLFKGVVCVVVGAGQGLGRQYALDLAAAGACVVAVSRSDAARRVVEEIKTAGGSAVAVKRDAREGDAIVEDALKAFGQVDAMIVNAGITRDRSFARMSLEEWQDVIDVHLGGSWACSRAVWEHFWERRSGTLLLTTSGAGLHGSFGQANYSAAKAGIIGLTYTLAEEGRNRNIRVNAIAPMASTAMTSTVFSQEMHDVLTVKQVAPFALALLHPDCPATGMVVEVGGGWAGAMRWQRSAGVRLPSPDVATLLSRWNEIGDFSSGHDFPSSTTDSLAAAMPGGLARAEEEKAQ